MFFFDTYNAVAAREDRKPKFWPLGRRHLGLSLTLWRHNVKRDILKMTCDCWFPCSCVYWSLIKAREFHVIDSISITQSEALWVHLHCEKCHFIRTSVYTLPIFYPYTVLCFPKVKFKFSILIIKRSVSTDDLSSNFIILIYMVLFLYPYTVLRALN